MSGERKPMLRIPRPPWIVLLVILTGCAPDTVPLRPPAPPLALVREVAVFDFEGGSVPPRKETQFWGEALASFLIADLRASDSLKLVDRDHLVEVLREQRLSVSNLIDPDTRLRVGRIVGADFFIFGTYTILGDMAFLTVNMDNVETGEVVKAEKMEGKATEMRLLSRKLSIVFLRGIGIRPPVPRVRQETCPSPEGVRSFSEGLDYESRGTYEKAIEMYITTLNICPDYQEVAEHLEKAFEAVVRQ